MIGLIKKMLGLGPAVDYVALMKRGAVIVDVRSKGEYASGHVKGSLNIPLETLKSQMGKLKKDTPIITCCASGMRSAGAKGVLKSSGFVEVYNGGSWMRLTHLGK